MGLPRPSPLFLGSAGGAAASRHQHQRSASRPVQVLLGRLEPCWVAGGARWPWVGTGDGEPEHPAWVAEPQAQSEQVEGAPCRVPRQEDAGRVPRSGQRPAALSPLRALCRAPVALSCAFNPRQHSVS